VGVLYVFRSLTDEEMAGVPDPSDPTNSSHIASVAAAAPVQLPGAQHKRKASPTPAKAQENLAVATNQQEEAAADGALASRVPKRQRTEEKKAQSPQQQREQPPRLVAAATPRRITFFSGSADRKVRQLSNFARSKLAVKLSDQTVKTASAEAAYHVSKADFLEPTAPTSALFEQVAFARRRQMYINALAEDNMAIGNDPEACRKLGKKKGMAQYGLKLKLAEWERVQVPITVAIIRQKYQVDRQFAALFGAEILPTDELVHIQRRNFKPDQGFWVGMVDKKTGVVRGHNMLGRIIRHVAFGVPLVTPT